ncbi:MAG: hypothetical protein R3D98_05710 [Candidatus Krumholzibacteriia bacterium]
MPTRPLATLLIVALLAQLTACTATRVAPLTGLESDAPVAVGQTVIVHRTAGDAVRGEVVAVTESAITVGKDGNYGRELTEIPAADIARIEVQEATGLTRGLAIVGGIVAGITLVGLIALSRVDWGSD